MSKETYELEDIVEQFPENNEIDENSEIDENGDYNIDEYDEIEDDNEENIEEEVVDIHKILKAEIVHSKFNKEFTSDIVVNNLTESFVILSNLLEEGRLAKDNVDKLFNSLDKLKNIVENMKESANKMNNINQIIDVINTLVRVLSANNKNIDDVIKILHDIAKKQKSFENDIDEIKLNNFIGSSNNNTSDTSVNLKIVTYINTFLLSILIIFFVINNFIN